MEADMIFDDVSKISKANSLFKDELSRRNFNNRFLYDLTGDINFAFDLTLDAIKNDYPFQKKLIEFAKELFSRYEKTRQKSKIIIFGTSLVCVDILSFFSYSRISRVADLICTDNNDTVWGKKVYDLDQTKPSANFWGFQGFDVKIVPPCKIRKFVDDKNCFIIIATLLQASEEMIYNQCRLFGFHDDRITKIPARLDFWLGYEKQYYDSEIMPPFTKDDIFIDGGAFDLCSSVDAAVKVNGGRVIAFEPDKTSYAHCLSRLKDNGYSNIELINAGLYSKTTEIGFSNTGGLGSSIDEQALETVKVVALDEFLEGNSATFIKMDIEGAELEALKGAEKTIKAWKPRLGICLYHKPFDVIDIPLYVNSLRSDYKFYIRHYHFAHFETVMYAI
jgi:FkbM family methyltransferase